MTDASHVETQEVTLLSGARLTQRKLTLRDQNVLAGAARRRGLGAYTAALTQLLAATTVEVLDAGPYADGLRWDRALTGDRLDALLHLRRWSYADGDRVLCDVRCGTCGASYGWEVSISGDLVTRPYPEATLAALRGGAPCRLDLDGWSVEHQPNTAEVELLYQRLVEQHPDRELSVAFRVRLTGVTSPDGTALRPAEWLDWLDGGGGSRWPGLTADAAERLRAALDAADGGYDTQVEAVHRICGGTTVFDLPFDTLLVPNREILRRRQARRAGP